MEGNPTFEERLDDTFARWLLDNRLHEKGEVTAPLADDFDQRLRAALGEEEITANLAHITEFVNSLPLEVQLHQVETADLRTDYEELTERDVQRTFASYQIPKNEELRAKLAAFGLAEKETKRVLKANKTQREKLLRQY